MRLIDADLLEDQFGISDEDLLALDEIRHAPTVDAVPVVRCKDCKYAYINSFAVSSGEALCTLSGKPMQQDDFCSYGEPKEGTHADDHD